MTPPGSNLQLHSRDLLAHETRIVIDALVPDVWRALTDPPALARWFAPKMIVEPGPGGFMLADWGPGLEWKTGIEVWEENRHLRTVELRQRVMTSSPLEEKLDPCWLSQDFYLEESDGQTVLRLIHSGFGATPDWDSEYDGTRAGWAACFLRLKIGLEQHRDHSVCNRIIPLVRTGLSAAEARRRIEAQPPWRWRLIWQAESHLAGVLDGTNGSLLTISFQPSPQGSVTYIEALFFELSTETADQIVAEWQAPLERLLA